MKSLAAKVWSELYKTIILLLLWLWLLRSDGVIHRSSSVLDPFPILELYQPLIASCLPRAGRLGKWRGKDQDGGEDGEEGRRVWERHPEGIVKGQREGRLSRMETGLMSLGSPLWALIGQPSPSEPHASHIHSEPYVS